MNRFLFAAALSGLLSFPALAQAPQAAAKLASPPDSEKLEKAAEALDRMKGALKAVLGRVEEARNEKDVVKLNCVNEKLTQIKGLLKVAEQSDIALHEAVANKDPAAETEFAKIGIARTKVDGLKGDADQCIGQLAYIVDEKTTVEVHQPPGLEDRDDDHRKKPHPTHPPHGPPVIRPRPASEWRHH